MACERANARGTGLRPGLDGRGGRLHMDPLAWTAEPAVSTGVVPGRQYFSALLGNPNSAAAFSENGPRAQRTCRSDMPGDHRSRAPVTAWMVSIP